MTCFFTKNVIILRFFVQNTRAKSKSKNNYLSFIMALITKIREKSGIAAAAIAISLVLFLVGSDIFQGKSSLFGSNSQEVGEIAGESIMIQDFQIFFGISFQQEEQLQLFG